MGEERLSSYGGVPAVGKCKGQLMRAVATSRVLRDEAYLARRFGSSGGVQRVSIVQ